MLISRATLVCFLFLSFSFFSTAKATSISSTKIKYYTEDLKFNYDQRMVKKIRACAKDKCLKEFYEKMEDSGYELILEQFQAEKERLQLNDFLYYDLVRKTVNKIYSDKKEMHKVLTTWFLMSKSGYDAHVSHVFLKDAFLYLYTHDQIFNAPYHTLDGRRYINITAVYHKVNTTGALFQMPEYGIGQGGKAFAVNLDKLPAIRPNLKSKTMSFKCNAGEYTLQLKVDQNAADLMKNYPVMDRAKYWEMPLSETVFQSLIPQFEKILKGKTDAEKMEILVSFTRSSFQYKWDFDVYEKDQPMIADEIFFSEFSDHEDRTALLFALTKELVKRPIIVIEFLDYVTLGVALEEGHGKSFAYNGRDYFVCDPTTPKNSCEIGLLPNGLRRNTAEVAGEYLVEE